MSDKARMVQRLKTEPEVLIRALMDRCNKYLKASAYRDLHHELESAQRNKEPMEHILTNLSLTWESINPKCKAYYEGSDYIEQVATQVRRFQDGSIKKPLCVIVDEELLEVEQIIPCRLDNEEYRIVAEGTTRVVNYNDILFLFSSYTRKACELVPEPKKEEPKPKFIWSGMDTAKRDHMLDVSAYEIEMRMELAKKLEEERAKSMDEMFKECYGSPAPSRLKDLRGKMAFPEPKLSGMKADCVILDDPLQGKPVSPKVRENWTNFLNSSFNTEEQKMSLDYTNNRVKADAKDAINTTLDIAKGRAALAAVHGLVTSILPIKWGWLARITGKDKRITNSPYTKLAGAAAMHVIATHFIKNSSVTKLTEQAQQAALLEVANLIPIEDFIAQLTEKANVALTTEKSDS